VSISEDLLDGMALAAAVADDRDGADAAPGLAPGLAHSFVERAAALSALDPEDRHAEVRRLASRLRRIDPSAELPVRARALLASSLPRTLARKWAAQAPPVRRGFRTDPALKATLRKLAGPMDPAAHVKEVDAAPTADPRLRPWADKIARGEDVERVLGALALGAAGNPVGDAVSRPWRQIGAELNFVWESPWQE